MGDAHKGAGLLALCKSADKRINTFIAHQQFFLTKVRFDEVDVCEHCGASWDRRAVFGNCCDAENEDWETR